MSRAEDIFQKIQQEGEKALDEFIQTQQSEELFLDFKRSANNGDSTVLDAKDRSNLAKAISGFGNSEGGVIVWGVECKKDITGADIPKAKFPIKNVKRFVSFLENAISGCTIPPHPKVRNHAVLTTGGEGFVATLIPKSDFTPHQDIYEKRYYIRAGSSFMPTPHDVLAGMFGKRPQPNVFDMFIYPVPELIENTIKLPIGFVLRNGGKVVAKDLFISIWVISSPGDNCQIGFEPAKNDPNWQGHWSFGRNFSTISKPHLRLPPASQFQPVIGEFRFAPPFAGKLKVDITCGCDGGELYKGGFENSAENIQKLYEEIFRKSANGTLTNDELHAYGPKLMGREDKE